MKYDFDEIIDRKNTNSQNVEAGGPIYSNAVPTKFSHIKTMNSSECGSPIWNSQSLLK